MPGGPFDYASVVARVTVMWGCRKSLQEFPVDVFDGSRRAGKQPHSTPMATSIGMARASTAPVRLPVQSLTDPMEVGSRTRPPSIVGRGGRIERQGGHAGVLRRGVQDAGRVVAASAPFGSGQKVGGRHR